jgi:hypothetical protein
VVTLVDDWQGEEYVDRTQLCWTRRGAARLQRHWSALYRMHRVVLSRRS